MNEVNLALKKFQPLTNKVPLNIKTNDSSQTKNSRYNNYNRNSFDSNHRPVPPTVLDVLKESHENRKVYSTLSLSEKIAKTLAPNR